MMMGRIRHEQLVILLFYLLGTFLTSLACPDCPNPSPPTHKPPPRLPPKLPPRHPPKTVPSVPKPPVVVVKPPPPTVPSVPKPPIVVVKPPPPTVPSVPKPPIVVVKPPPTPTVPNPPVVHPPIILPPVIPTPPIIPKLPPPTACPPPPPKAATCPIDALKLGACVDALGGLIHIGLGGSAKSTCCPLLEGISDVDAAVCLCTTIKAKLLNLNILIPIALEVLVDCGKTPPPGFQCPSS